MVPAPTRGPWTCSQFHPSPLCSCSTGFTATHRQVLPQGFLSLSIPKSELITRTREPSTAPQSIPPSPPAAPDPPPDRSFLSQRSTWWGTKDNEHVSVWKHEVRGGRARGHMQRGWLRPGWHPCERVCKCRLQLGATMLGPREGCSGRPRKAFVFYLQEILQGCKTRV